MVEFFKFSDIIFTVLPITVGGSPYGGELLAPNRKKGGAVNEPYISRFTLFCYVRYRTYLPGYPGKR